jgi:hypothetical protein
MVLLITNIYQPELNAYVYLRAQAIRKTDVASVTLQ